MAKKADKYFLTDPWKIVELGFNQEYSRVAESIFSLGNEYMGVRGYFEEGYSGDSLLGSYFNGVYEQEKTTGSAYKGIVDQTEFMVNAVDWLYTRIRVQGETLDLATAQVTDFVRELDMRNGLLTRSFVWTLDCGAQVKVELERFLSMQHCKMGGQRIRITSINEPVKAELDLGIDFGTIHQSRNKNYWTVLQKKSDDGLAMLGRTKQTRQMVWSLSSFDANADSERTTEPGDKCIAETFTKSLNPGTCLEVTRIAANLVEQKPSNVIGEQFLQELERTREQMKSCVYEELKAENEMWWKNTWAHSDIQIEGDEENQQGIRFCIFQLFQTYLGVQEGDNIGAKGLTGEAYNGNAFWDTETYCLPFYIFQNVKAAKSLLTFRYVTLPQAKTKAEMLDCAGAFYPIATISGRECCDLWQHASLQLQASTAVVYAVWLYDKMVKDREFLEQKGIELLVEVCRMLATRGSWSADGTAYGYYCVMGPDEFQMMVNHDCYTNYMARFSFDYTQKVLADLKQNNNGLYEQTADRLSLKDEELAQWQQMSEHMYIPRDDKSKLYEQHKGFFELPHVDVDQIPIEDFPLYSHWSYDRIYRNDMIKQPDVLMLMLMFRHSFTEEELKENYEYYEPRCIHESSLSPSVHSILAAKLKKHEEAFRFFQFATRMDLDNYNRNSGEGIHTTSIAAAWMNIVCGFGGMQFDGDCLEFSPSIPAEWSSYSFRIIYQGEVLLVTVDKEHVCLQSMGDKKINLRIYGKEYELSGQPLEAAIPKEWRG